MLLPPHLHVSVLPDEFAVARLPAEHPLPDFPVGGGVFSVTVTPDEISIVCPMSRVPDGALVDRQWRALKVEGPLKLDQIGTLASLLDPLMAAGVSVFVLSTYDTEYVLVKESQLRPALTGLRLGDHRVDVLPGN
jgi:hypothetical protein